MTDMALATAQVRQDPHDNLHVLIVRLERLARDLEHREPDLDQLEDVRTALISAFTLALGALLDGDAGDYAAEEMKHAIAQLLVCGGEPALVMPGGSVARVMMPHGTRVVASRSLSGHH